MEGKELVHLDSSDTMDIKVFAEIFNHQSFQMEIALHPSLGDTLDRGGNLAENSQLFAAIVKPGTLQICHSELKLGH